MKTPTKEQIKRVARVVQEQLKSPNPYMWALGAILEWEKIRDL